MVRIGEGASHVGAAAESTHDTPAPDAPAHDASGERDTSIRRGPTLQDLMSHSSRMPTDDQLAQGRAKLRKVRTLDAGPLDATGEPVGRARWREQDDATGLPRVIEESAHAFVDAVASMRHEIADVKASLDEQSIGSGRAATFARKSMQEWAGRTHRAVAGLEYPEAHLDDAKRKIYVNWRANGPETSPEQRDGDARAGLRALKKLDRRSNGVDVRAQTRPGTHPAEYEKTHGNEAALNEFAYYVLPKKPREFSTEQPFARLTVNFDADALPAAVPRIGKTVNDRRDDVGHAKIMGPARTGGRVDDAVVYMTVANPDAAREIDAKLRKDIPPPQRPSTAPGMEPLSRTSAYAEYVEGSPGSHEMDRGEIVKQAVAGKLDGDARPLTELMRDAVERAGYDPQRPSHLAERPAVSDARPKRRGVSGFVGRLFGRK
ncbi:T3SS effector HopA1 family protein [Burkholderia sp. BCC1977]|uniref:T3SS effector HopA1 family protein n=1 Tax=Burkholderia sp. BCC1977 TaxID=2817440 RepID=UPI002ABD5944|nr:T3SS effector HopA1 family protein [Burkholderia sp. BCC1977]